MKLITNVYEKVLHSPTEFFDFDNPPFEPKSLVQDLGELMIKSNGVGLSAPQVGFPYSVFVVGNPKDRDSIIGFFNPKIVDTSDEIVEYTEGCLTYPGLFLKVKRPSSIRIRFTDMNGEISTQKFSGFTARVIQHEYDHLKGEVFINKVSRFQLEKARRELKKMKRKK